MPTTNFIATEVNPSGLTALIKNLGRDCHPTQFLREFAKNALEACQRTGDESSTVTVDYNEELYSTQGIHKICFIDNGDGMTAEQMISLLNNLSSSGEVKNEFQNYGVGAKISALTRNHCGIQYESWKDGKGHLVFIKYNATEGIYGIAGVVSPDGLSHYAIPLGESNKPPSITTHGTRVTLWGMEEQQDTMLPPEGMGGIRESWVALYLNTRFFRVPEGINLRARIGYYKESSKHNYLSNIHGQKATLDEKAIIKGEVKLTDAKVYWWVMPKGVDGHGRELVKGHTALIHENEIFDISDARSSRSAYFGVIVGRDRVVIYVEPNNVVQNTARTNLVRPDGSPVLWDKWQDEFRSNMPEDLRRFLEELQNENTSDSHTDSIKERLKAIKELYKISRYKVSSSGTIYADPDSVSVSETGHLRTGVRQDTPLPPPDLPTNTGPKPGPLSTALLTALVEQNAGVKAVNVEPDPFPTVKWVSDNDNEQLLDRAAEYISTSNQILANKNFQGIKDVITYFSKSYADVPEVVKIIEDEVRQAFEQALTECVAGALSMKNRRYWKPADFDASISKEALTTAVMQRYWLISHVKRVLGSKIKGFNELAA